MKREEIGGVKLEVDSDQLEKLFSLRLCLSHYAVNRYCFIVCSWQKKHPA
jgi:hypothetical protein